FGTSSVQLTWTASDATSGIDHFEVRLDGGTPVTVAAGTATYTFTGVSDGTHTLALKAFDRAGNTVLVSVAVSVDATAPTVSIVVLVGVALLAVLLIIRRRRRPRAPT